MAKFPTYPTLFDDVLQIFISKLKEWKYSEPDQIKSGAIRWSVGERETAKISIWTNMNTGLDAGFIELDYRYNGEPVKYRIRLVSLPSNIGKGKVWYFECPQTKKRCRKLYLVGRYFLHREAFKGCMYEIQTKSKETRAQNRLIEMIFRREKLYEQLCGKHFTRSYNGKPTKKYVRLMKKIKRAESVSASEIERILLPKGCCL
jgi:hypothetical protein